jgi:hypothetical protein
MITAQKETSLKKNYRTIEQDATAASIFKFEEGLFCTEDKGSRFP